MTRRDLIKGIAVSTASTIGRRAFPTNGTPDSSPRTPQEVAAANAKALSRHGYVCAHLVLTDKLVAGGTAATRRLDGTEGPIVHDGQLSKGQWLPAGTNTTCYWLGDKWLVVMAEA